MCVFLFQLHGNKSLKIGLQRHLMKIAEIDEAEL